LQEDKHLETLARGSQQICQIESLCWSLVIAYQSASGVLIPLQRMWNALSASARTSDSYVAFRQQLKTQLFKTSFNDDPTLH